MIKCWLWVDRPEQATTGFGVLALKPLAVEKAVVQCYPLAAIHRRRRILGNPYESYGAFMEAVQLWGSYIFLITTATGLCSNS